MHKKHHRTHSEAIEDVNRFINSIPTRESHYSQNDKAGVRYLDPTLNCTRLYQQYEEEYRDSLHGLVRPSRFSKIFNFDFNLRFGYPRSDKCATCEMILLQKRRLRQLRTPYQTEIDRLEEERQKHLSEAEKFYSAMRAARQSDDNVFALCMDFCSNLPLPLTKVEEEYYKRQLWISRS